MTHSLTPELASRFAGIALGHIAREYPNKQDHVLNGPNDVRGPRELHPIFYGSFDWHSCVHGHWLLASLLRLRPDIPQAGEIRTLLDAQFTPPKVAGELAYLARPDSRGFERPYGWAWLLMLAAELERHKTRDWAEAIRPLAQAFSDRFRAWLPIAHYPNRTGAHPNTAFALALAWDYAVVTGYAALAEAITKTARAWYGQDAGAQAWEPDGDAFLSPVLIEAECMRRVLPAAEFGAWFARFLPEVADEKWATLFTPAQVSDRSDGKIAHLDGLNLSRAWCWRSLAPAIGEAAGAMALAAAERHLAFSLPHVAGDYAGEHWLASFALLALS